MTASHISVLYKPILEWLNPQPDGTYIDGTLGLGGHTRGILDASAPTGQVLAFDRDSAAIALVKERLSDYASRLTIAHASYSEMGQVAPANGFPEVDGIVLDLGLSSYQMDTRERGFSFRYDAPLDMRFDQNKGETAGQLLNTRSSDDLADIFWRYGEEKNSRRIARKIFESRPLETTKQLADLIVDLTPKLQGKGIHPATRVFQALRIAVNDELVALEEGLEPAVSLLKEGGRLAVISFHSLEDRIVKRFFKRESQDCICSPKGPVCVCGHTATLKLLTKKPIVADSAEIAQNPRSRSAKLRVVQKL